MRITKEQARQELIEAGFEKLAQRDWWVSKAVWVYNKKGADHVLDPKSDWTEFEDEDIMTVIWIELHKLLGHKVETSGGHGEWFAYGKSGRLVGRIDDGFLSYLLEPISDWF